MSKTLNTTGVAKELGIHPRTLKRMIKDGRFPVEPIENSKPLRWSTIAVEKWCLNGEVVDS